MKIETTAKVHNVEVEIDETAFVRRMIFDTIGTPKHCPSTVFRDGDSLFYEDNPDWSEHAVRRCHLILEDAKKMEKFLLLHELFHVLTGGYIFVIINK